MLKLYRQGLQSLSPWQISLLAAVIYGSWAGWVNSDHGSMVALRAGLVQASYAFVSTALVTYIARYFLLKPWSSPWPLAAALGVGWSCLLAIPLSLHHWQNTPDIFEAIAPGLAIGTLYLYSYCHYFDGNRAEGAS
ncbi:hypothetical protein [Aliagarivorans taiwanensis]|uniref:hypothetical protein n=1 Tax=Aliagarivorans taiwanensis TaxID=561966 RepID=UPI0004280F82|nr:hypothetical protein [Aliagarivorans taiwanensis]